MKVSREDLRRTMLTKTDEELYILLHIHPQGYTPEALEAAHEEFGQRKLDEPTMERLRMVADAEKSADAWRKWRMNDAKETASGWGLLILLCLVGFAIYSGYGWLDSIGWISHREDLTMTVRSDWLVGESKECSSATLNSDGAALLNKEVGYALSSISCDDGPEHQMKVIVYGRKVQTEYKVVSWRCTRDEVSFTCYQTGGRQ